MEHQIYERIKALCKENGTNISELERFLGFARGSIYKIDEHQPSANRIQRIADYLHTSVDFLLHGKEEKTHEQTVQELMDFLLSRTEKWVYHICSQYGLEHDGSVDTSGLFKVVAKEQLTIMLHLCKKTYEGALREIAEAMDIEIE